MSLYEEEIDLRPYIQAVVKRWWQILLAALFAALIVYFLIMRLPLTYQATATLLLIRSRDELALAEQFRTEQDPIDLGSRIETIRSILTSDSMTNRVLEKLDESVSPGYRSVDSLKGSIQVESLGDLLFIHATAADPQDASAIANSYADLGEETINQAYSEGTTLNEIQKQRQNAQGEYEMSQKVLEEFIQTNQIVLLETQAGEAENVVASLAKDINTRIRYYSQRKQAMEELALEAKALKEQIAAGGASTAARLGDALAVLRLRANAFDITLDGETVTVKEGAIAIRPPARTEEFNFDLQLSEVETLADSQNITRDLDRFIALAEQEAEVADAMLQESQGRLLDGDSTAILEGPTARLQVLKSRLEEQEARERELESQRDLAWRAYQAIAQKETEIRNGSQSRQYVNFASPATAPESPMPRNAVRNTVIAGILTTILLSFWILIMTWWSSARVPAKPISQPTGSQASD